MTQKPNILVVCSKNKRRSRTAEYLYKNDTRINIRSVGLSPQSAIQIHDKDIGWADIILVMEDRHQRRLIERFRALPLPIIEVLQIPDDYEYLDPELIEMLRDRLEDVISRFCDVELSFIPFLRQKRRKNRKLMSFLNASQSHFS